MTFNRRANKIRKAAFGQTDPTISCRSIPKTKTRNTIQMQISAVLITVGSMLILLTTDVSSSTRAATVAMTPASAQSPTPGPSLGNQCADCPPPIAYPVGAGDVLTDPICPPGVYLLLTPDCLQGTASEAPAADLPQLECAECYCYHAEPSVEPGQVIRYGRPNPCPPDCDPTNFCTTGCIPFPCPSDDDSDEDGLKWYQDSDEPWPFSDENYKDSDGDGMPDLYDISPEGVLTIPPNTAGVLPNDVNDPNGAAVLHHVLEEILQAADFPTDQLAAFVDSLDHPIDLDGDGISTLFEVVSSLFANVQTASAQFYATHSDTDPNNAAEVFAYNTDGAALGRYAQVMFSIMKAVVPHLVEGVYGEYLQSLIDFGNGCSEALLRFELLNVTLSTDDRETTTITERTTLKSLDELISTFLDNDGNVIAREGLAEALRDVQDWIETRAGDPVITGTGELIVEETDLLCEGRGQSLAISRRYGSRTVRKGLLGPGWTMPLLEDFMEVWWGEPNPKLLVISWGDGNQSVFKPSGTDPALYVGTSGEFGQVRLSKTNTCASSPEEPPGFTYRTIDNRFYYFCPPTAYPGTGYTSICWLRAVTDPEGNAILISRDALGRPRKIVDTLGRDVILQYDQQSGRLAQVADWAGRTVVYSHDQYEDLRTVVTTPQLCLDPTDSVASIATNQEYEYWQEPAGPTYKKGSPLNHNLTRRLRNGIETLSVEYYHEPEYSFDKVKSEKIDAHVTQFKYEEISAGSSPWGQEVSHVTSMLLSSGEQERYYHGKGLLYAREQLNARFTTTWAPAGSSYTSPVDGITQASWVTAYQYDSELRLVRVINQAQSPQARHTVLAYPNNGPRPLKARPVSITHIPEGGALEEALTTTFVYDAVTGKARAQTDNGGRTILRQFSHYELPYNDVAESVWVKPWGLLPALNEDPVLHAEYSPLFGQGDLNGDGLRPNTFRPVKVTYPSVEIAMQGGPGSTSLITPVELTRYDANGQVAQVVELDGVTTEFEYLSGYLTKRTVSAGALSDTTVYENDSLGRPVKITFSDGRQERLTRRPDGKVLEYRWKPSPNNSAIGGSNLHVSYGNLEENNTKDIVLRLFYDADGNLLGETGKVYAGGLPQYDVGYSPVLLWRKEYSASAKPIKLQRRVMDWDGTISTNDWVYEYDGAGRQVRDVIVGGGTTEYLYNARGDLIMSECRRPTGVPLERATYHYNVFGEREAVSEGTEDLTIYGFDGHGRLTRITSPSGFTTELQYDVLGRVVTVTDNDGQRVAVNEYDNMDRLIKQTTTNRLFKEDGSVEQLTPSSLVHEWGYGLCRDNPLWELRGTDELRVFTLDSFGRTTNIQWGGTNAYSTSVVLDVQGRVIEERVRMDPEGTQGPVNPSEVATVFKYDNHGRPRARIDALGRTTQWFCGPDSQIVEVIEPSGLGYILDYNTSGLVTRITQVGKDRTTARTLGEYDYNIRGHLAAFTDASGVTTFYRYDAAGNQIKRILPNGYEYRTRYDLGGRVIGISLMRNGPGLLEPIVNIIDSYDEAGRIVSEAAYGLDADVMRTYTYDSLDRMAGVTETVDGKEPTQIKQERNSAGDICREVFYRSGIANSEFKIVRDAAGRIASSQWPSGSSVGYAYDDVGRLIGVTRNGAQKAIMGQHYGLLGARLVQGNGGLERITNFDGLGRVMVSEWKAIGGATIDGESLAYVGSEEGATARTLLPDDLMESFAYDTFDRLQHWIHGSGTSHLREVTWSYDLRDNVIGIIDSASGATAQVANGSNEVVDCTPHYLSILYNGAGLEVARQGLGLPSLSWQWDALGRPLTCTVVSQGQSRSVTYSFDGLDRLRERSVSGAVATSFAYVEDALLAIQYGTTQVVDVIREGLLGVPIMRAGFGGDRYYAINAHGDVTAFVSTSGAATRQYYEPYGVARKYDDTVVVDGGLKNTLLFDGNIHDYDVGMTWAVTRMYDGRYGRFLGHDPLEEEAGWNLFSYGFGNPMRWRDPSGTSPKDVAADAEGGEGGKAHGNTLGEARRARSGEVVTSGDAFAIIDTFVFGAQDVFGEEFVQRYRDAAAGRYGDGVGAVGVDDALRALKGFIQVSQGDYDPAVQESVKFARSGLLRLSALSMIGHGIELGSKLADLPGELTRVGLERVGVSPGTAMLVSTGVSFAFSGGVGYIHKVSKGQLHHVMTITNSISSRTGGPWTPRFEALARKAGVSLDSHLNKVVVKGHWGPHSKEYHMAVYKTLVKATQGLEGDAYRHAFRAALSRMRKEVARPGTPLNRLLLGK